MKNEQQVRTLILRVQNVAETGHPDGKPYTVYIYADGKNGRKQVTLEVGFTEDSGNLAKVLKSYIAKPGSFADQLSTYFPDIGKGTLATNKKFHQLLKQTGDFGRSCCMKLVIHKALRLGLELVPPARKACQAVGSAEAELSRAGPRRARAPGSEECPWPVR